MPEAIRYDDLHSAIEESGVLTNIRPYDSSLPGTWVEGETLVEGSKVTLQAGFLSAEATHLPVVRLDPWDALGRLPHVGTDGVVCYRATEGVVVDRRRPGAVLAWALGEAVLELGRGVRGENAEDFLDEFEAFWRRLPGSKHVLNVLDPPLTSREVVIVEWEKLEMTAASATDVAAFLRKENLGTHTVRRGTFVTFPPGSFVEPPRGDRPFWTPMELRELTRPALEKLSAKRRRQLLGGHFPRKGIIVLAIPRPTPGAALVGVGYDEGNGRHPLAPDGGTPRLYPVQFMRLERSYLVPRGGGDADLSAKRAVVVGCGAVGGHVAHELVRAGILNLVLVDPDVFSADNTFRHVLGFNLSGNKASTLADDIRARYPYVRVSSVDMGIEEAVRSGHVDITSFDVAVVATGAPSTEMWLNEQLHQTVGAPPTVFTWVEPYGIGGHAVLVHPGQTGCVECLYTWAEPENALRNKAAFAAPGQNFARALSGCGTLHTPYGSLDASRTANLAVRLALQAVLGDEPRPVLRSWKGQPQAFKAAGFRLSHRFGAPEDVLNQGGLVFSEPLCPICSGLSPCS